MKQTWHLMSWLVSACLLIAHWEFLMHAWILRCDIDMIDYLDWGFRCCFFLYFIARLVWYIDMSIVIDCSSCLLGMTILSLPDYSAHFTCIDSLLYVVWLAVLFPLTCILFWSSLSMMIVSLSIWLSYSRLSCVYIDDISELCLIACCMTTLLCVIACRLSVWVAHLSPYLPLSSLGHFLHSGSRFCKCEALCVLVLWPR